MDREPSPSLPRYCTRCGEIFDATVASCPECGTRWPRTLPVNRVEAFTLLLTELAELRRADQIDAYVYWKLRDIYEARLKAERPARRSHEPARAPASQLVTRPAFAAPSAAAAPGPGRAAAVSPARARPPAPPRPPRDTGAPLRLWAARRQADLLLYLGAFLLSVAALIFVDYQGSVLGGPEKSAILGTYTVLFLGLGMGLQRWERVREAGPVFVALGAILTPLNFVLLYTGTLRDGDTPQAWVWLGGSAATAALYFVFAARGYGRYYAVPGAVAALVAWGSLGATVELPLGWYGAWFMAFATAGLAYARWSRPKYVRWVEASAAVTAFCTLAWAHAFAAIADTTGERLELSATYAPVFVAVLAIVTARRSVTAFGLLPLAGTMTVAALGWGLPASHDASLTWASAWPLLAATGYLAVALADPKRSIEWVTCGAVAGGVALALTHATVADGDVPERLPAVYAAALLLATAVYARWRFTAALGVIPALAGAAPVSALWASDRFAFEWSGVALAAVGVGYVLLTLVERGRRDVWRSIAVLAGALALAAAHAAAATPDTAAAQLPVVYAIVIAAAVADALVNRQAVALLIVPAGVAGFGASLLWSTGVAPEYWAAPALAVAIPVAAMARFTVGVPLLERTRWAYALTLVLAPLTSLTVYEAEAPVVGAVALAVSGCVFLGGALFSRGALAWFGGAVDETAQRIERQMLARVAAAFFFGAAGFVADAFDLAPAEAAYIYAAFGVAALLAVPLIRKRLPVAQGVLAPTGFSGLVVATLAAYGESGQVALMLAAGAMASGLATGGGRAGVWRTATAAVAVSAVVAGHNEAGAVVDRGDAWELPVAYAAALFAVVADIAITRFRPSLLAVPLLVVMTAGSTLWVFDVQPEHWGWAPLAVSAIVLGTVRAWRRDDAVTGLGHAVALGLGVAPIFFVPAYGDDAAALVGAAQLAAASLVWLVAAFITRGSLGRLLDVEHPRAAGGERTVLQWGAAALGLAALAQLDYGLELPLQAAGWTFAGAGLAGYLAVALAGARIPGLASSLVPAATCAILVGVGASDVEHGAVMLGLAAAGSALTYLASREPVTFLLTATFGAGAMALAWGAHGWPAWSLGLAYGAAALALYAALGINRGVGSARGQAVAWALSVVPMAVALVVGMGALVAAADGLAAGESLAVTAEWKALAGLVAMVAALVLSEGYLRREGAIAVAGSLMGLLALEMAIGSFEPDNVQWYTAPFALYLLGMGLTFRRSEAVVPRHLFAHELLFLAGAGVLFLPQAEQSYDGHSVMWAVIVLAEGMVFLGAGMALGQRWLVVSGVVASVGVAVRFFTSGEADEHVPYWLTLGLAGLALLGVGMLLLLARDWWDRTRQRLGRWWIDSPAAG